MVPTEYVADLAIVLLWTLGALAVWDRRWHRKRDSPNWVILPAAYAFLLLLGLAGVDLTTNLGVLPFRLAQLIPPDGWTTFLLANPLLILVIAPLLLATAAAVGGV